MGYRDPIVIDPEIRFGKPRVRGTRITVGDVLSYLTSGMTEQQVLADFPQLMSEDIRACLAFAAECERKVVRIPVAEQHVLLFDEISRRGLSQTLGIFIWVAPMVGDWGLTAASDRAIWQYGRDHGLVIFTKDEDFQRFSILYGRRRK